MDMMSKSTSIDTTAVHPLGYIGDGVSPSGFPVQYVYVKHVGSATSTAGKLAGFATVYGTVSMSDATIIDTTLGTIAMPAGVYQSALTTNAFGWLQVSGPGAIAGVTDQGIAAGDIIVMDGGGTPDGVMETMAAGEEHAGAGYALDADAVAVQVAETYIVTCRKNWR